ncbi:MAG: septation protein IspZ [Bdellovibrionaceae bacterium]|nr:septation protein IspZ [Pseudobdellovibrionaceae bacterium]
MVLIILIPLLVFALVETFGSVKTALIAAMIAAVAEVLFSYLYFGHIDSFSVASIFLVLLMGGLAYKKESRRIFYLKPAILSFAFGAFLVIAHWMGNHVLLDGVTKYSELFSEEQRMIFANDSMMNILRRAGLTVGIALIFHGLVSAWAAFKLSRWWWLTIAGLGIYIFMFVGMLFALF